MIRMMAKASELFAKPPKIAKPEILASKAKSLGAASRWVRTRDRSLTASGDHMLRIKLRSGRRFAPSFYVGPEGPTS